MVTEKQVIKFIQDNLIKIATLHTTVHRLVIISEGFGSSGESASAADIWMGDPETCTKLDDDPETSTGIRYVIGFEFTNLSLDELKVDYVQLYKYDNDTIDTDVFSFHEFSELPDAVWNKFVEVISSDIKAGVTSIDRIKLVCKEPESGPWDYWVHPNE